MTPYMVVTGGSRGIGRATALAFAQRGLNVAVLGRSSAQMDAVLSEVRAVGVSAQLSEVDLARADDVKPACQTILSAWGAPSVVVNNAGVVQRGQRLWETTEAEFRRVMEINLVAAFAVARALVPAMLTAGTGRLVHVASISATLGAAGAASYGASKWAMVGLSKALAEELRGTGVQSIAVLPGSVDTEMLQGSGFAPQMTAAEVAQTIVYLALDAPAAMNGAAVEMFGDQKT